MTKFKFPGDVTQQRAAQHSNYGLANANMRMQASSTQDWPF